MPTIGNHTRGVFFVRTIDVSVSVIDRNESHGAMTVSTSRGGLVGLCDALIYFSNAGFGFRMTARYVVRGRVPRSSRIP